jgi:hypothetical protein
MKQAHWLFETPLSLLHVLRRATVASESFVDEPYKGLADLHLLPSSLLFSSVNLAGNAEDSTRHGSPFHSIADLIKEGRAEVKSVSSDALSIHEPDDHTAFFELMRADVDGDGIQDIVFHWGGGPLRGTLSMGEVLILSRRSNDEPFSVRKLSELPEL